jgi:hypothetical protein
MKLLSMCVSIVDRKVCRKVSTVAQVVYVGRPMASKTKSREVACFYVSSSFFKNAFQATIARLKSS